MTVTIIVVLELILCAGWISQSNAQVTATLFPQEHQSVCRGQYISYDCIGNGDGMFLYSPPVINESGALTLLVTDSIQTCKVVPDSASAFLLVDSSGSSSFVGTLTLLISHEQSEGQRSVYCRVATSDGTMATMNSTTYSVLGPPSLATVSDINSSVILSPSDNPTQVAVNISWLSPDNAQEFILTISSSTDDYMNTISSRESRVTVLLPCGTYSANLCVRNRCGSDCKDFLDSVNVKCQSASPASQQCTDTPLLVAAIIAGVMGVLMILAIIYGVIVTVMLLKTLKKEPPK